MAGRRGLKRAGLGRRREERKTASTVDDGERRRGGASPPSGDALRKGGTVPFSESEYSNTGSRCRSAAFDTFSLQAGCIVTVTAAHGAGCTANQGRHGLAERAAATVAAQPGLPLVLFQAAAGQ